MNENTGKGDSQPWYNNVFFYLIVAILALVLVTPLVQEHIELRIFSDIFSSTIIIVAVFAASGQKRHIALAIILALPTLLSLWAAKFLISDAIVISGRFFGIAFMGFVIVQIAKFIHQSKTVSTEVLFAAIAVYLLLAVMWEFIYSLKNYLVKISHYSLPIS